jgi:hypothetical protein
LETKQNVERIGKRDKVSYTQVGGQEIRKDEGLEIIENRMRMWMYGAT